jgi:tRNA (guanine37-N1)-methyltransferase
MKITFLTIFPQLFDSFLASPIPQRAIKKGVLKIDVVDIKDYSPGSFRHIDDSPFGGGPGMVMRCQPVLDALRSVKNRSGGDGASCNDEESASRSCDYGASPSCEDGTSPSCEDGTSPSCEDGTSHISEEMTVAMTPAGRSFDQKMAHRLSELAHLILICGHYEGMDERIYRHVDEEISIGDYVLTGGEIAAMVVSDAVIRLLPGALRGESTSEESFENGLLEYPQYTQPAVYEGEAVPEVLTSGNHARIRRWRLKESLRRTLERRPDLLEGRQFTEEELALLEEIRKDAL